MNGHTLGFLSSEIGVPLFKSVIQRSREQFRLATYSARQIRHRLKPNSSYAADREDIAAELLLGRVSRFIDVGANDGISLSNTALLTLRGARGLCFEPNPTDYRRLSAFYLLTPRVECIQQGLSDHSGTMELRSDGLLSAMVATEDAGLTKLLASFQNPVSSLIAVSVDRLSHWLDKRPDFQKSDVLSIDVEGHELNVLSGIDWARHPSPARCLIIETHSEGPGQTWLHRDYEAISELLARQGYDKVGASANNTFWLKQGELTKQTIRAAMAALPGYRWFVDAATSL